MIGLKIFTWFWKQALLIRADSMYLLLLAGRETEIGRRAADIMDIAFKIRLTRDLVCFVDDGLMAAGLDDAPLMKGQGTKAAPAKAAAVAYQAELHLRNGRNTAVCLI